jgi:hypothetical protein
MTARVIGPLVLAKDREGRVGYWYFGQEIPWLAAEDRARLEADGLIAPAQLVEDLIEVATEFVATVTDPAPAAPTTESGRPWSTATRAVWVDYVVSQGIARADAEELTKKELMALVAE